MISQILQYLDSLQVELSAIDPAQDFDAADKVAGIALALRDALPEARPDRQSATRDRDVSARNAA